LDIHDEAHGQESFKNFVEYLIAEGTAYLNLSREEAEAALKEMRRKNKVSFS
jgi:hypothetical protein